MKKTVVLIHGAFAGAWSMENFAKLFKEHGWDCYAPNLRYHERDPAMEADPRLGQLSIEDYTNDMAKLIGKLPALPILVGHSMGGVIAQKLAARGLAQAVVLINSSTIWGIIPSTDDERSIATGLMTAGPFWKTAMRQEFEMLAELGLNTMNPAIQRAVFERMGFESGRAVFELFFWMFDREAVTKIDFDKVTCPIFVVTGAKDRGVSTKTAHQIARSYSSQATLYEVPGAGHYLMLEKGWEKVAEHCAQWMSEQANLK